MSKGLCIVTGGSRGIGAATAVRAAADGWDIAIVYANARTAAESVAARVEAAGARALAIRADVSREAEILALFEQAEAALGPVRGLVNSAGTIGKAGRVVDLSEAVLRQVIDLNLIGLVLCCREAARRMSTRRGGQGGAIVNVSSAASRLGNPGEFVHYAASKGAVDSFTLGMAREVAAEGVRVTAISPGMIDTEIHAAAGIPDRVARLGPATPIGRAGTAEECAEAAVWLLSDAARYCVGTIIGVDGGR